MTEAIKHADWVAAAKERYSEDFRNWAFCCPSCGVVTKAAEWIDAGAEGMIAFSCIGRTKKDPNNAFQKGQQPCNYAGGGLFRLNPVKVDQDGKIHEVFDFADRPLIQQNKAF